MLLFRESARRRNRDAEAAFDRMVEATAVGFAVAVNPKARDAWHRRMAARNASAGQTVDQYRATLGRLAGLTTRGGKPLGLVN